MKLARFIIPCRILKVQVQYGDEEGLSGIEQLFLQAIAAGADTLESVVSLLRLPDRMSLDLAVDMLQRSFIEIERPSGRLVVSSAVLERMGDPVNAAVGWAAAFASPSPPAPEEVEVFQDCVSGTLFRPPKREFEPGSFGRTPLNPELPEPDQIPKVDLMLVAASDGSTRENDSLSELSPRLRRVLDVSLERLETPGGAAHVGMSSLLVTARCWRGSDIEPPRFTILEPGGLPTTARRRIATGLSKLWETGVARGSNQFFATLPYEDGEEDVPAVPVSANALRSELESAVNRLNSEDPRAELHQDLARLDNLAKEATDVLRRNAGSVSLVHGARQMLELALQALAEAKQQVVLICPWMKKVGRDGELSSAISGAVSRGIQVHLLWGVSSNSVFSDEFSEAGQRFIAQMNALGRSSGGALYVATHPTVCHAKVIVCDLDWMVVGSSNFLNRTPDGPPSELGIRVAPPSASGTASDTRHAVCATVGDALAWARTLLPDFRIRRALADDPTLFGRRPFVRSIAIEPPVPEATWDMPISRSLWSSEWHARLNSRLTLLTQVDASPALVADAEHRELLFSSLAGARKRVIVASPRLGIGVLGTASISALERALKRTGVSVAIVSSNEPPETSMEKQRLADERPRLRGLHSQGLQFRTWDSHAKVLIADDEVIIGSFNYLSFEGYYDGSGKGRHELSVRVGDKDLADSLSRMIEESSVIASP